MVDEQAKPGEQPEDDEPEFEAPTRGSADELLDAGAHAPIDAMRHSTAHVMAEAVLDLFPGAKLGIGPAIDNGFYYDFELPRAAHARRPGGDRGADGEERQGRPPVRAQGAAVRRSAGDRRGARARGSRSRSSTTSGRRRRQPGNRRRSRPSTSTAHSAICAAAPTSSRRGRSARSSCSPSPAPTGAATRRARRCSASTARSGRRRRSSTNTCGGARRPRSATTAGSACSSTCSASTTSRPGRRSGTPRAGACTRRCAARCASSRTAAATRRSTRRRSCTRSCGSSPGHWALYRDNMYLVDVEGQWFSLKPMNCPESSFIYRSRLRSYRDLPLRLSEYGVLHRNELSGVLSGLTRVRHFVTDDAHIYVRPDQIASEIEALMGEIREAYGWFGLDADAHVRHAARQGPGRPRRVGRDRGDHADGARPVRPPVPGQGEGRRVLRAQARHPDHGCARPGVADGDHPGRPRDAARAVRPPLHRRARPAAAARGDPPRDLRVARAVHRRADRALRRRVPAVVRPGPGGHHPDR